MLVLSRKQDEWITMKCGDLEIRVGVVVVQGGKVKLGIVAPKEVTIHRDEVLQKMEKEGGKK